MSVLFAIAQHGGPLLIALIVLLFVLGAVVGAVVLTSIWSSDLARRRDARETLKLLLRRRSR